MSNRNIRRDRGVAKAVAGVEVEIPTETSRTELIGYEAGNVADLVFGDAFYNADPFGGDNEPYWQVKQSGMKGYLIRLRNLPKDFVPSNRNFVRCNFKVVKVTKPDGFVTIAVTGMPTDAPANCKVVGHAERPQTVRADALWTFSIRNTGMLGIYPLTQVSETAAAA